MKYAKIFGMVQPGEQNEYLKTLGDKTKEVLVLTEKVKESLSNRYRELEKARNERLKTAGFVERSASGDNALNNGKNHSNDELGDNYEMINSRQLVEAIESHSKIEDFLIIDIRNKEQFDDNFICANKLHINGTLRVINIPKTCFHSGLAFHKLDRQLQDFGLDRQTLNERNKMKSIVIVDENDSSEVEDYLSRPAVILADILYKVCFFL